MKTKHISLRLIARWAGWGLVALASVFFIREVIRQMPTFTQIAWDMHGLFAIGFSTALMLLVVLIGGGMWFALLRDQNQTPNLLTALRIVALSQIAKYLPGNVGHLVGQVTLAKGAGIPIGVAMTTLTISSLWLIAIGVGLGSFGILSLTETMEMDWMPSLSAWHLAALTVILCVAPWVGILILNCWLPKLSELIGGGRKLALPRISTALLLGIGFTVCFFIFGLMLELQATYLFNADSGNWLILTLLFTGAWVSGYLVPGAPGGIGVREAMMIILLTPIVGGSAATGLGISMRVATTAGDALAFVLGTVISRWEGHSNAA